METKKVHVILEHLNTKAGFNIESSSGEEFHVSYTL